MHMMKTIYHVARPRYYGLYAPWADSENSRKSRNGLFQNCAVCKMFRTAIDRPQLMYNMRQQHLSWVMWSVQKWLIESTKWTILPVQTVCDLATNIQPSFGSAYPGCSVPVIQYQPDNFQSLDQLKKCFFFYETGSRLAYIAEYRGYSNTC